MDFAKRIGISTSLVGQIERGTRVPTQEQLKIMASELHIELEELLGESNQKGKEEN
jgi:transcriptional regulator with XRE-family HTH domain